MSVAVKEFRDLPAWSDKMGQEILGSFEDPGHLRPFLEKLT